MTMPLAFVVRRAEPVLVGPAAPTPRETKRLSYIDELEALRSHVPLLFVYRGSGDACGADSPDPVATIRRALGQALVPYYPLAGRLREVEEKLVVHCTSEGVMFVEADADVRLVDLEVVGGLVPPLPWVHQLLCDSDCLSGVLNSPLLFIQVTRLLCGGIILALHMNHIISDGIGINHFLSAVAELARGLPSPTTTTPPWSRELLEVQVPSRPQFPHYEDEYNTMPIPPVRLPPTLPGDMVVRTFTFTRHDVTTIKKCLPTCLHGPSSTTFEALSVALWRAHIAALELSPCEEVSLVFLVSLRGVRELGIPTGYYGNAIMPSMVLTTAGELLASSLGDTVQMVREAKAAITAKYVREMIDLDLLRRHLSMLNPVNLLVMTDNRHLGFHCLDLGYGVPVYGGIASVQFGRMVLVPVGDNDGKDAVAVPVMLPPPAMDRFASELVKMVSPSLLFEHSTYNRRGGHLVSLESCKALFPRIREEEKA